MPGKIAANILVWDLDGVLIEYDPVDPSRDWRADLEGKGLLGLWEEFQESTSWNRCLIDSDANVYDAWSSFARQRMIVPHHDDLTGVVKSWLENNLSPNIPALECLRTLRLSGYSCVIASNQDTRRAERLESWLTAQGLEALPRFLSCQIGAAKPEPGFFRRVEESLGVENKPVLIDDRLENVFAARSAGWPAFHVMPGFAWEDFCTGIIREGIPDAQTGH